MRLPQWGACKWTARRMLLLMQALDKWMVEWISTKDLENQCHRLKEMITLRKSYNSWPRWNKKTKTGRKCYTRKCSRSLKRRESGNQLRSLNCKSGKPIGTRKRKARTKLISRKPHLSNRKWSNPSQEKILGWESLIIARWMHLSMLVERMCPGWERPCSLEKMT